MSLFSNLSKYIRWESSVLSVVSLDLSIHSRFIGISVPPPCFGISLGSGSPSLDSFIEVGEGISRGERLDRNRDRGDPTRGRGWTSTPATEKGASTSTRVVTVKKSISLLFARDPSFDCCLWWPSSLGGCLWAPCLEPCQTPFSSPFDMKSHHLSEFSGFPVFVSIRDQKLLMRMDWSSDDNSALDRFSGRKNITLELTVGRFA